MTPAEEMLVLYDAAAETVTVVAARRARRLPHRDVDTRRRGLELLIRNAALLTARERRYSLRLVRLWQQLLVVNLRADAERLGRPGPPSLRAGS